jgi:exocyst complex component 2
LLKILIHPAGLTICGCNCLLSAEWKTPNKIVARSGPGNGKGDIIVMTKLGGVGVCTVQFRGYMETVGPLKESAVWVEEETSAWGRRALSPAAMQQQDPLGLSVEDSS